MLKEIGFSIGPIYWKSSPVKIPKIDKYFELNAFSGAHDATHFRQKSLAIFKNSNKLTEQQD